MHVTFKQGLERREPSSDRFAVFAVLFEVANQGYMTLFDKELQEMIKKPELRKAINIASTSTAINLNFLKAFQNQPFYHYEDGSLPSRPCNEPVDYLIAKNPLKVRSTTLGKLRQVGDILGEPLVDNSFRSASPPPRNVQAHLHVKN